MDIQTDQGPVQLLARNLRLPPNLGIVLPICRELHIARIVDELCPMKWHEHLTHGQVVEALILHILQSEHRLPLYKLEEWALNHNVGLLYQCPSSAFNDDRVGDALDALVPPNSNRDDEAVEPIDAIEGEVVTCAIKRYDIDVQAIHWDLTNVTFSGAYEGSERIGPGWGHGTLNERQLQVSLHATGDGGIPVHYECLAGGAQQPPLAEDMLKHLQSRLGRSDLIVVADGKGISYDIVKAYRRAGAHFVSPLSPAQAYLDQFAAVPLEQFRQSSYRSKSSPDVVYSYYPTTVDICPKKRQGQLLVDALLVHSTGKQARERKVRRKKIDKALKRLAQIESYLNKRLYFRVTYARARLANAVPVAVREIVNYELEGTDGEMKLRYWVDEQAQQLAARNDGRYLLIHELPDSCEPEEPLLLYKRQPTIEARFRNLKNDLSVHPLWLKSETRIAALLFVFILALIVFTLLERCSERAGLDTEYYHKMTAREMLFRFGAMDVQMVQARGHPPSYELHLSDEQQYILQQLAFPDPAIYITQLR